MGAHDSTTGIIDIAIEEIIIASPVISGAKVEELVMLLKNQQEKGVWVRIVTWSPDSYGFGDSAYWMELQERMPQ